MGRCVWVLCFLGVFHTIFASTCKSCVVEITSTVYQYDFHAPWGSPKVLLKKYTGTLLENGKILTTAGAAEQAVYVDVRVFGTTKVFPAKVLHSSSLFHLALLEVHDPAFSRFVQPVSMVKQDTYFPQKASLYTYHCNYPEFLIVDATFFTAQLLDPQENSYLYSTDVVFLPEGPFCSGAAIFVGNKLAGITHQFLSPAGSQSYAKFISASTIKSFLQNPEPKTLEISYQNLDNPCLRNYYDISEGLTGILLVDTKVNELQKGDILLAIEGHEVQNDGTIYVNDKKFGCTQFIARQIQKEQISCTVLRNRVVETVQVPLTLLKNANSFTKPSYYIYAGLVFQYLDSNSFTNEAASLILLSHILSDDVNIGYNHLRGTAVATINGVQIVSLKDVARAIEEHDGQYHKIETRCGGLIVFDRAVSDGSHVEILKKYGIPKSKSLS